ncbi:MAG: type II secretion system F family protein [Agathobacter rectalis]
MSEPITACGLFPPMVSHMTRIGEETGDLEGMLTRLADYYDEEVELATQTVMAAIEPMIILVLALIVGVLVAAVMAPMLTMYQAMDSL